jgi:hypothetical protein
VSAVSCAANGGLAIQGYQFGIDSEQPALSRDSVAAQKFTLVISRAGAITERKVAAGTFRLRDYCASPVSEQEAFCSAATREVGQ